MICLWLRVHQSLPSAGVAWRSLTLVIKIPQQQTTVHWYGSNAAEARTKRTCQTCQQKQCVKFTTTENNDLWRIPLTSSLSPNTSPHSILLTIHVFMRTQAQESACLQRSKTTTHITHITKSHISTLKSFLFKMWGNYRFLKDVRQVFIWVRCRHGDLWLARPVLWDTKTSASKSERKCRALPVAEPSDVVEI